MGGSRKIDCGFKPSELENVNFRRSLYFVSDLKVGEIVSEDVVRSVGPRYEIEPKWKDIIVGKTVNLDVKRNTQVSFDLLNMKI